MLTTKEAVRNLRQSIREESLIQGEWSAEEQGRHVGCAMHQMGGKEVDIRKPSDCPASVMPQWLAEWLPLAFDGVPADAVYAVAEDFAATLEATVGWTPGRWELLRIDFLCGLIDQAVAAAEPVSKDLPCWIDVFNACDRVKDALRGNGDLTAARAAAEAAAMAARAAVRKAWAAAARAAARAATEETAWAARWAAAGSAWDAGEAVTAACREQFAMLRRLASV